MKTTRAFALLLVLLALPLSVSAGTLGPAFTYKELLTLAGEARDGDVLLVSGDVTATGDPLKTPALLQISGDGKAAIRQLRVSDSSIVFSDIELLDSFAIDGVSNIELRKGVHVEGAGGKSGLTFSGSGTLLIDSECTVTGGSGATGITLTHRGGDLYVSIESSVRGGGGQNGGSGTEYGGSALILMDASGASNVNLNGSLIGGDASSQVGEPGQSLQVVGDNGLAHAHVLNCLLQDGENTFAYNSEPDITPLPEITSSIETLEPIHTPSPTPAPEAESTPEPKPTPSIATPDEAERESAEDVQPSA